MQAQFYPLKASNMGVELLKERLHLRIEQADEQLLKVLAEVTESLFKGYRPEALEQNRQERIAAYEASLKPMTKEELVARALEAQKDIEAGNVYDIEDIEAELGL